MLSIILCKKCYMELQKDFKYCPYCGFRQSSKLPKSVTKHANGMGTAYKRGNTWTAKLVIGYKKTKDGRKVAVSRTKGGFASKKDALQYIPFLSNTKPKKIDTLEQIWEKWKTDHEKQVGSTTMAGYAAAYNHFSDLHLIRVNKITANMLQEHINNCKAGKRTRQVMKVIANLLMKYAMDDDQIIKNPAANLKTGKGHSTPRDPITEKELSVIHDHLNDEPYASYVYALCYLGFRPTEFLKLTKSDFHFEDNTAWLISGSKTEAGIDRPVTIPPIIRPIIDERLAVENTDLLFPRYVLNRKGEFKNYSIMTEAYFRESVFKPLMSRLGIDGKVPYSARHTYSNKIKRAAGNDTDKAALIGHSDYQTTRKFYQSTDLEERKTITDQLS